MGNSIFNRAYKPIKKYLPNFASMIIRSIVTILIAPSYQAYKKGFIRSSLLNCAVDKQGKAIPWYTYSCIYFLNSRDFSQKQILEIGSGQSTLWWQDRAKNVLSIEENEEWFNKVKNKSKDNVKIELVTIGKEVDNPLNKLNWQNLVDKSIIKHNYKSFDVIIIDGGLRTNAINIAKKFISEDGIIIADNSEGGRYFEEFKHSDFLRVDFTGEGPGVIDTSTTSIYFQKGSCFAFRPDVPMEKPI